MKSVKKQAREHLAARRQSNKDFAELENHRWSMAKQFKRTGRKHLIEGIEDTTARGRRLNEAAIKSHDDLKKVSRGWWS